MTTTTRRPTPRDRAEALARDLDRAPHDDGLRWKAEEYPRGSGQWVAMGRTPQGDAVSYMTT